MASAVINNKIFYAGGYEAGSYAVSDLVQIYDIATNSWSTENLSQARAGIATASFGNIYLFAGGLTKVTFPPSGSATVDIYTAP
jgi:N-acetylneuraminic acid mutarotase